MIYLLACLARIFYPFRYILFVVTALLFGFIVYSFVFVSVEQESVRLMPAFLALLWTLLLSLVSYYHQDPALLRTKLTSKKLSLFKRIKSRFKLFILNVIALIFILLSLAVVIVSYRMLAVWS